MDFNQMEQYWIWLSSVDGIGPKRFYQLISIYEDARAVWDNVGDAQMQFLGRTALKNLREARTEEYFYRLFSAIERMGMRPVTRIGDHYPPLLNQIYDPPATLYVLGDANLSDERCFSIVGSRRCTRDGERAAREFGETLAREGVTIVSGMARGIDTCAHEGALLGLGKTIAVLGCGADIVYPPENQLLYNRILDNGGAIVSEYTPGTQPLPKHFPLRNRIISGLSRGTLVVEGAERSGAMITVNDALDQNRDVFAVPGSIYGALSAMPNRLIVEGATPVITPWQILEFYDWAQRPDPAKAVPRPALNLDPEDDQIVKPLLEQDLSFDELANLVDFPVPMLISHLTMLELRGIIVKVPGGQYRAYNV